MSRNVIVGLAILVVAALSWIVIDRMSEGDVAVQGDGSAVEIEQEALVVEEDEIPPTVATPEEDVQNLAKNNDSDPLEQQVENASENDAELSEAAEMAPDLGATDDSIAEEPPVEEAEVVVVAPTGTEPETVEPETVEVETIEVETVETEAPASATESPALESAAEAAPGTEPAPDAVQEPRVSVDVTTSSGVETETSISADAPAADTAPEAEGGLAALLTPETFDADAIRTYVETSEELDAVGRDALMTALDQAEDNPEFIDAAILALKRRFEIE